MKTDESPAFTRVSTETAADFEPNRPEPTRIDPNHQTASTATLPVERFKYRGRQWRIFKRSAATDAAWYIYWEANKKRMGPWSLGSSSKQHALAEAKLKIDLHYAGRDAALRGSLTRTNETAFAPISAIIGKIGTDDYGILLVVPTPKQASGQTRKGYGWSLRWVLRLALELTDEQVDNTSSTVLNKITARKFFDAVAAQAATMSDQAQANAYVRSAYSIFNNSRALFAPRALEAMRENYQLKLPDLAGWRDARKTFGQVVPQGNDCELPSDAIIRHTLREWIRLANTPGYQIPGGDRYRQRGRLSADMAPAPLSDTDRRNLFITVGLELSCGFRVSETKLIQRHWITTEAGLPLVRCTNTHAKNRTGKIEVSPLNPFWKILWYWIGKNNWDVATDDYLLQGAIETDRTYWPEIHVSRWLRSIGWQTQKTNHALRDFSASMITMRYGLGEACDWCRHATISTTERHYSRFVKLSKRLDPKKLAWLRWAK